MPGLRPGAARARSRRPAAGGVSRNHSIQTKTLFGSLPTQHGAFAFLGYEPGSFPVAEYVGENGLHFGCHQHLTPEDLAYVAEVLRDYFKQV